MRRTGFLVAAACCAFPATSHLAALTGDVRWAAFGLAFFTKGPPGLLPLMIPAGRPIAVASSSAKIGAARR